MCWGFKLHSGDHQFSWGLRTSACTRKCLWAGWFAEPGGTIQPEFYHNSIDLYFMTWFSTCLEYEEIKLFLAPHFRRWAAQHRAIHAVCAHHQARISTQKPPGVSPDYPNFWASGVVRFYGYTDTPCFQIVWIHGDLQSQRFRPGTCDAWSTKGCRPGQSWALGLMEAVKMPRRKKNIFFWGLLAGYMGYAIFFC